MPKLNYNTTQITLPNDERRKSSDKDASPLLSSSISQKIYHNKNRNQLKLSNVHKFIISFGINNSNVFDLNDYKEHMSSKMSGRTLDREIEWKLTTLSKMEQSGYLLKVGSAKYTLTDKAILFHSELKKRRLRQAKSKNNNHISLNQSKLKNGYEIKITKFDLDNILALSKNNILEKVTISTHSKSSSIEKRVQTFKKYNLLIESTNTWIITPKLLEIVNKKSTADNEKLMNLTLQNKLNHKHLSNTDKKIITSLKTFLNLTENQILKHTYNNDWREMDYGLRHLINRGFISKKYVKGIGSVYVLTIEGSKIASSITGDTTVYSSKIHSKPSELKHDLMLFDAYKDAKKELESQEAIILTLKTDRQLKSEDMRYLGKQRKSYPDLQIEYLDINKEHKIINLEVDRGYSVKEIVKKLNIPNLIWYTHSSRQKEKVLKKARYMKVKIIDEYY